MPRKPAKLKLKSPPIVEAVLDIDCDMRGDFDPFQVEVAAAEWLRPEYPKSRRRFMQEIEVQRKPGAAPQTTAREALQALQFLRDDEKQLVQIRPQGFSFNRLAPYSSFDEYLPEIERTWQVFVSVVAPVQIRLIRLRYINRFLLPMRNTKLDLSEYLTLPPRWPDEEQLLLTGFFDRRSLRREATGELANVLMTFQQDDGEKLPVILDIETIREGAFECANWQEIHNRIASLRVLKNSIFSQTLTKKCLKLFR
jgi:uncharacterized protein (TIGR04255 family)